MNIDIDNFERFEIRHNGPDKKQIEEMLEVVKADSLDALIEDTIPKKIRLKEDLELPSAVNEFRFLQYLRKQAVKNKKFRSYIGMGYYDCITPPVILRNIFENPGWYTSYTPYQAEISQGRLEALVNFQTMVMDLTGMTIANASLLDEGTAAAEAMTMLSSIKKGSKKKAKKFFIDQNTFPQTIDVLKTRAEPLDIELVISNLDHFEVEDDYFGLLIQYPNNDGEINDISGLISKSSENDIRVCVAADLMALAILTPPGELGADVVVGSSQRFGIPMGYGGPHAAFFATREEFKRQVPGRIIGVSQNKEGFPAYRMALQTREQHIRREKATSNICTAQVLLAVMAGMYAVYHGPNGLRKIAERIHGLTILLAKGLERIGFKNKNKLYFDTLKIELPDDLTKNDLKKVAEDYELNFRYFDDQHIGISMDEACTKEDVQQIINVFQEATGKKLFQFSDEDYSDLKMKWPKDLIRSSGYLEHPVFNSYHSEHEMLRYLKRLENKDLSLVYSMISLGSCTMKLNATSEMIPISWPEFNLHPFAPVNQAQGYHELFLELHNWLCEMTGYPAVSLQPNSGAQGEFAGLMVIRAYHKSKGEDNRNITLIPSSAHGTNPASAVMAGTKVIIVDCDDHGNIDLQDLKNKAEKYKKDLAAIMITYPSTHGVFEENISEICDIIHKNGGQVYMDGANMNAQVGLTTPAIIGADVCHLNLHKTFCIPHGGGGPGMGPIGVAEHLKPFLPGNPVISTGGDRPVKAISAAPWGSASILPISYAYIAMMGLKGLVKATKLAILNANYIKARLKDHYPILYTGKSGRAAHEFILDCRDFKKRGIEVEDVAKRLMDYGFHAPTMSFPVPGTMMIEPTESETKEELDRFCDAFIQIREEIREIEEGKADPENNVLKNAPHTQTMALADDWDFPYSREKAVYPLPYLRNSKFWPASSRVDNAYGDRNLFCACVPVDEFKEEEVPVG